MPRDPHFNPTERIIRLLVEFELFKFYTDAVLEKVYALPQETVDELDLPHEPTVYEFALERERMRKTHGQIMATRLSQQRVRMRGPQRIRKRGKFKPHMMDEIISAAISKPIDADDDLKLIEEIKKDFFK